MLKKSNSGHKIYVRGNQFLSQEINSSQNNFLSLVEVYLSICLNPPILPEVIYFVGTWFPGSQWWICRPGLRRHPFIFVHTYLNLYKRWKYQLSGTEDTSRLQWLQNPKQLPGIVPKWLMGVKPFCEKSGLWGNSKKKRGEKRK